MKTAELTYALNRLLMFRSFLTAKEHRFGLTYRFKIEDCVGRYIYKHGTYEDHLTDYLLKNLKLSHEDIILDIGENIGWYSMMLTRQFQCQAYAFEPAPMNFDLLTQNVKANQLKQIKCINLAVSDKEEQLPLHLYKKGNGGRHSLLPINEHGSVIVQTTTLNQFCHNNSIAIDRIKFLKIDIEGYEYQALKGGSNLLGTVPLILSEFTPDFMRNCHLDPMLYLNLFIDSGYEPKILSEEVLQPVTIDQLTHETININIFWVLKRQVK